MQTEVSNEIEIPAGNCIKAPLILLQTGLSPYRH